jgi:hypothetical protein
MKVTVMRKRQDCARRRACPVRRHDVRFSARRSGLAAGGISRRSWVRTHFLAHPARAHHGPSAAVVVLCLYRDQGSDSDLTKMPCPTQYAYFRAK